MQPDESDVVFDSRMRVLPDAPDKSPVVAPAWKSAAAAGEVKPLDAHHKMLHEGAVLSSHFENYETTLTQYMDASKRFFNAADDFIISTGYPSKFRPRLNDQGAKAASAVAAAAAAAQRAGATLTAPAEAPAGPTAQAAPVASDSDGTPVSSPSAFAGVAAEPALPVQGPVGGVHAFPAVPGTPTLAAGDLTDVVPEDILLPRQHQQLFRHDEQRRLIAAGRAELMAALSQRVLPALQLWGTTYEECKLLLPQVERMRLANNKARTKLEAAKAKVIEAEAAQPLVPAAALASAGTLPRVLAQGAVGGELVAAPAAAERQELYEKEDEQTDAELSFELSEKVLRDKLSWLMRAGGAIKAMVAAAAAAALHAAAAEGGSGEAAGGTAAGQQRAPKAELLEPFPQHVLARLRGEHLHTLPQLVQSDHIRLRRWATRFKAAMAAHAAATAAAAGAEMLAAAAAAPEAGAAAAGSDRVAPAGGIDDLARTDDDVAGQAAAASVGVDVAAAGPAATAAPTLELLKGTPPAARGPNDASSSSSSTRGMVPELRQAAEESQVPLDLLAAAAAADVEDQEVAAAAATRVETAWRLLHDASVVGAKESAVLVPVVRKHIDASAAELLSSQLHGISDALRALERVSPPSPGFDLAVLEALEVITAHSKELEVNILPVLASKLPLPALQDLAKHYRRAAATAPTRPHGWFLGSDEAGSSSNHSGRGIGGAAAGAVTATAGAVKKLLGGPAKAGVALADAAADLGRFGPGNVPLKAWSCG